MIGWLMREKEERGRCSQELNGFCFMARKYLNVWRRGLNVSASRNVFDVVSQHARDS